MANCRIAPYNWIWEGPLVWSGGGWSTEQPVDRLATLDTFDVARSLSADPAATRFTVAFHAARRANLLRLLGLKVSESALIRVRGLDSVPDFEWDALGHALHPLVTFSRASAGWCFDDEGILRQAAVDEPRWDHIPSTRARLGLLREPARTNINADSVDLTAGGYSGFQFTATANQRVWLQGASAMALLTKTGTDASAAWSRSFTLTGATRYTWSADFAAGISDHPYMVVAGIAEVEYDLSALSASITSGAVRAGIELVRDGIYRAWMVYDSGAGGSTSHSVRLAAQNDTIYCAQWQVEAGDGPSSRILTSGGTATRAKDSILVEGANFASFYAAGPGTLAAHWSMPHTPPSSAAHSIVSVSDGTGDNRIDIFANRVDDDCDSRVVNGGVTQATLSVSQTLTYDNTAHGAAVAWATNDARLSSDGDLSSQDTSVSVPTVDRLEVGDTPSNHTPSPLHLRYLAYWATRKADARLQAGNVDHVEYAVTTALTAGWVAAWPTTYAPVAGEIDFGRDSADGKQPADEADPRGVRFAADFTAAAFTAIHVEIDDADNAAGYVEAWGLFIAKGEVPAAGVDRGATIGPVEQARLKRSKAGTLRARREWVRDRMTGTLSIQHQDQAFPRYLRTLRRVGRTSPILFEIFGSQPNTELLEDDMAIVGTFDELTPVGAEGFVYWNWSFAITSL